MIPTKKKINSYNSNSKELILLIPTKKKSILIIPTKKKIISYNSN